MSFNKLIVHIEHHIATISFNDAPVMNAIDQQMLRELKSALETIQQDGKTVRALVLTGENGCFSTGLNLQQAVKDIGSENLDLGYELDHYFHPIFLNLRELPFPIISKIPGACVGISLGFALMGDYIIASDNAYFMLPFTRIGLVPDGGSTFFLPRLIGKARTFEMGYLTDKIEAKKAKEWGMINDVVKENELDAATDKIVTRLATGPTKAFASMRQAIFASYDNDYKTQLNLERDLQRKMGTTNDFVEGVKAFVEKRKPDFKGN